MTTRFATHITAGSVERDGLFYPAVFVNNEAVWVAERGGYAEFAEAGEAALDKLTRMVRYLADMA